MASGYSQMASSDSQAMLRQKLKDLRRLVGLLRQDLKGLRLFTDDLRRLTDDLLQFSGNAPAEVKRPPAIHR
jgi:hypothetical protein